MTEVVKTHVRDTTDFITKLNRCRNENIEDIELATVDIIDMYPSINKTLGIEAIKYYVNKYPKILRQLS